MMGKYLEIEDLSVGYHGVPLIKHINASVGKGEIFTLIGPNGAGKSTILKTITSQLPAVSGNVKINGKPLDRFSGGELAKSVAVVLTERLHPELMSCYNVVSNGRYPYTGRFGILTAADRRIIEQAMLQMQVKDISGRDFNAISDGQRQRVLLARAVCQEPEMIVLDEPTSFLDVKHKLELLEMLREMAKGKGMTIVMSLHEIDLAQKISDRIMCVYSDGKTETGTPEAIFQKERISALYGIGPDSYDPDFGSVEMKAVTGEMKVFVLAGNGYGIRTFRTLQKLGVSFATGILFENDIDFSIATRLSGHVVSEKAFCAVERAKIREALDMISSADCVIDTFPKGSKSPAEFELLRNSAGNKLCTPEYAYDLLKRKNEKRSVCV